MTGHPGTAKVFATCISIPMEYTASQLDWQGTPVNTLLPRNMLTTDNPNQDSISANTSSSQRQVEISHHASDRMTGLLTH